MKNNKLWVLAAVALAFVFISCSSSTGDKPKEEEKTTTQSGSTQAADAATYTITIQSGIAHGSVSASKTSGIKQGETVTLSITADEYFEIGTLSVKNGETAVTVAANNSFTMPAGNVTINATFIYKFNQTVTYLPEGTDGTLGTSGTYVLFGDWPQTEKADDVDVAADAPELERGGFTFYKGSDDFWYVKNADVYYKVEPIKWRILNPEAAEGVDKILLAENILEAGIVYYGSGNDRDINTNVISRNNYAYSNIRAYLNGTKNLYDIDGGNDKYFDQYAVDWSDIGFLQGAFTTKAQSLILDKYVNNSSPTTFSKGDVRQNPSPYSNDKACQSTKDKIFLLSLREITDGDYGFTEIEQGCVYPLGDCSTSAREATDYAASKGTINGWWLRSPDDDGYSVHSVGNNGCPNAEPSTNTPEYGVVPAIRIE